MMHLPTERGTLEDQVEQDLTSKRAGEQRQHGSIANTIHELTTLHGVDGNISETESFFVEHKLTLIATVSITGIVLLVGIVYVCANRKYRLNWFQKNVLLAERESHERQQHSQNVGVATGSLLTAEGGANSGTGASASVTLQDVDRSGDEADATTRLLIHQKAPEISYVASGGNASSGSWRSMLSSGTQRNASAETGPSSGLLGTGQRGQGQGKRDAPEQQHLQRQLYNGGSESATTITVNYVSLRRCDRQQSSCDSVPSSPTSVTLDHSGGLTANSLSCQNAGCATKDSLVKPIVEKKSTETGNGNDRSNLLERRLRQMGALASRVAADQCRIIVEDVTRPPTDGDQHGSLQTFAVDTLKSSGSSEALACGSPLVRRGSLTPVGPNASVASRRSSNASWTSWGSGNGQTPVVERDTETQFWVPASVAQRSRARSLVQPSSDHNSLDINGGLSGNVSVSPVGLRDTSMFIFSTVQPAAAMTLLECPSNERRRRASMHDALDHTQINTSLYERPPMLGSNKHLSCNVQEDNLGSIQFSLFYDTDTSLLNVHLIQASELQVSESAINTFARLRLLPDTNNRLQTRMHLVNRSPYFDETFIFEATPTSLRSRTLELEIFHQQKPADEVGNKNTICRSIGQVTVPLDHVDLNENVIMWKGISACENTTEVAPVSELMFSLSYLPSAERLTVVIVGARNLKVINKPASSSSSSLSVKALLYISGKKYKRRKTSCATKQRDTSNPVWNEALVFSGISKDHLLTCTQLELIVCGGNAEETFGKVKIGANSVTGRAEHEHWMDMLNGRPAIAKWHQLVSFSD